MNEQAGKNAVLYGGIGERYAIKKFNLKKSKAGSYDAVLIKGNLKGMTEIPVEIKSAQLLSRNNKNWFGQFGFNKKNHEELGNYKGFYIFVFMCGEDVLFCLKVLPQYIEKVICRNFRRLKRRKGTYFTVRTDFYTKVPFEVMRE